MRHAVVDRMVVIDQIEMIQLEMADCWTLRIGGGINTGTILVLVLTGMMIGIIIYRRSDWGYFSDEFKKQKAPTFD